MKGLLKRGGLELRFRQDESSHVMTKARKRSKEDHCDSCCWNSRRRCWRRARSSRKTTRILCWFILVWAVQRCGGNTCLPWLLFVFPYIRHSWDPQMPNMTPQSTNWWLRWARVYSVITTSVVPYHHPVQESSVFLLLHGPSSEKCERVARALCHGLVSLDDHWSATIGASPIHYQSHKCRSLVGNLGNRSNTRWFWSIWSIWHWWLPRYSSSCTMSTHWICDSNGVSLEVLSRTER